MDSLTFSVPDATLAAEIGSWQDGKRYTFDADQTAPWQFTLVSGAAKPVEELADETPAPATPKPAKGKNPAIDNYIGSMA